MKNKNGITLIALVISIIVMLILAGISLNLTIGENGIITKAQMATFAQKIAKYKEEIEMNIFGNSNGEDILTRENVTVLNNSIKKYIPSIEENDLNKFGIIAGELYYLGDTSLEKEVCIRQGINVKSEEQSLEEFIKDVENKAIEAIIKDMAGDAFTKVDEDGNEVEIGVKLYDKNLANGNKWKIITEIENGINKAMYGSDWYYVEAGNSIEEIGILKSSYIINYNTQKAVRFDATKHTMLAYGGNLSTTDNLIFNFDSALLEGANPDDITEKLGDGVELHNFDWNENSGLTKKSIKLDGVDDYITFLINSNMNFEDGITFEFYGKIDSDVVYNQSDMSVVGDRNRWGVFFSIDADGGKDTSARMVKTRDNGSCVNFGWGNYSEDFGTGYNIPAWNLAYGEEAYLAVNMDIKNEKISLYKNGECVYTHRYEKSWWQEFLDITEKTHFSFGGAYYGGVLSICGEEIYAMRVYEKPLSEKALKANYNATISYYDILINGGNAGTGGDTGGSDIEELK